MIPKPKAVIFVKDYGTVKKGMETNKLHPVLASKLINMGVAKAVTNDEKTNTVKKQPKTKKK